MILKDFKEFKDLQGKTLKPSEWLQVEQEMIDHFAAATKDYQWIHVDQQRAEKESPYKSTIAHGFLSISLIKIGAKSIKKLAMHGRILYYLTISTQTN